MQPTGLLVTAALGPKATAIAKKMNAVFKPTKFATPKPLPMRPLGRDAIAFPQGLQGEDECCFQTHKICNP